MGHGHSQVPSLPPEEEIIPEDERQTFSSLARQNVISRLLAIHPRSCHFILHSPDEIYAFSSLSEDELDISTKDASLRCKVKLFFFWMKLHSDWLRGIPWPSQHGYQLLPEENIYPAHAFAF